MVPGKAFTPKVTWLRVASRTGPGGDFLCCPLCTHPQEAGEKVTVVSFALAVGQAAKDSHRASFPIWKLIRVSWRIYIYIFLIFSCKVLECILSLVHLQLLVSFTHNLWCVSLFSVCCRQLSVPRDDDRGILLGRPGRQSGKETVSSDMHVGQRILCLPFFICPRLWLFPLLPLTFWIRVRFSPYFIAICFFLIVVCAPHSKGPHCQEIIP